MKSRQKPMGLMRLKGKTVKIHKSPSMNDICTIVRVVGFVPSSLSWTFHVVAFFCFSSILRCTKWMKRARTHSAFEIQNASQFSDDESDNLTSISFKLKHLSFFSCLYIFYFSLPSPLTTLQFGVILVFDIAFFLLVVLALEKLPYKALLTFCSVCCAVVGCLKPREPL